jgi:hypothetical protein
MPTAPALAAFDTVILPFDGRTYPAMLAALTHAPRRLLVVTDTQREVRHAAADFTAWLAARAIPHTELRLPAADPATWDSQLAALLDGAQNTTIDLSAACPAATLAAARLAAARAIPLTTLDDDRTGLTTWPPAGPPTTRQVDVRPTVADVLTAHGCLIERTAGPPPQRPELAALIDLLGTHAPTLSPLLGRLRTFYTDTAHHSETDLRFRLRDLPRATVVAALAAAEEAGLITHARVGPSAASFRPARSEQARHIFCGDWLELYVHQQLAALAPDDVQRGVRLLRDASDPDTSRAELDLAAVLRDRLLIVECKTGSRLASDPDAVVAALERLSVLRESLGGTWADAALVIARPLRHPQRVFARARELDIPLLDLPAVPEFAARVRSMRLGRRV